MDADSRPHDEPHAMAAPMTGFDIAVLVIVGLGAIGGFLRGFVHECLTLAAWIVAVVAIHMLLSPLSIVLLPHVHSTSAAWVLAFAILFVVPYFGMKLLANRLGSASRNSVIGPIDRVLGFGFGAVKGTLIVVLAFAVVALGYDVAWGRSGRPIWLTQSRTYPFINACSDKLVAEISARRHAAQDTSEDADSADDATPDAAPSPTPTPRHHHKHPHAE
jgi:membrane protein required for colicin V production